MFTVEELNQLEATVVTYIGEFEGAVPSEVIAEQQRLLEKIMRQRWITARTPFRFKRSTSDTPEMTGVILEFMEQDGTDLVRLRVDSGLTYRVAVTDLIGPA